MSTSMFDILRKAISATGNPMDRKSLDILLKQFESNPRKRTTKKKSTKRYSKRMVSDNELRDLAKSKSKNTSKMDLIKALTDSLANAFDQINKTTETVNSLIKSNNDLVITQKKMEVEIKLLKGEEIPMYGVTTGRTSCSVINESAKPRPDEPTSVKKVGRSARSN